MTKKISRFEQHEALEEDIEKLKVAVEGVKNLAESRDLSDKEILRAAIDRLAPGKEDRHYPGTSPVVPKEEGGVLPGYAVQAPDDVKFEVETLIDEAFHEGVASAVRKARNSSPFVLDAFHDALTGKLYDEFKKRDLL